MMLTRFQFRRHGLIMLFLSSKFTKGRTITARSGGIFLDSEIISVHLNFRAPERTTAREGGEGCCTQDDSAHSPERPIITRSFTEMPLGSIYVFGAAIGNSSWNKTFDQIKVYSMIDAHAYPDLTEDIKCCVIYGHGESEHVFEASPLTIINHFAKTDIRAFYTTCLNAKHRNRHIPLAVGLTMNGVPCVRDSSSYVKPFVPLKEPGTKLALGTQLAFGNISAEMIIEWMEAYRSLGVDKVVTFYHKSLNENALRVLKYYHESEFLDLYYFEPAAEGRRSRQFNEASYQTFNDLSLIVKETFERMSGYTYFGIIDFDEFLIPSWRRSLKKMLNDLFRQYQDAAGFQFKSQYFYLSWGPSGDTNDLILGRYTKRTELSPEVDRAKFIYMPARIAPGGARTHGLVTLGSYKQETASVADGYIRHFRKCRKIPSSELHACLNTYKRVSDTSIATWSNGIKDRVHYVRKHIFGNDRPIQ